MIRKRDHRKLVTEAAPENDDQDGKILPKIEAMLCNEPDTCYLRNGFACSEPVGEAGTHDAGEDGYGQSLAKGEVALPCLCPVLAGNFMLFRIAGEAADGNRQHAHAHSGEYHLPGALVQDGGHLAAEDRWHQGAERGTKAERDCISKSNAEVANGEAEGESAYPPHHSPETCVVILADGAA